MENKENILNLSNKTKSDIQSSNQEVTKNQIDSSKNYIIFRNKKVNNENKNLDDDNLDHPQPLSSDFEGRDDFRKTLILKEIKENNNNSKIITQNIKVQNINDEYFKSVNNIKKIQIYQSNEQNQKKIERVNLNEINNSIFKNKFKIKKKEENKNNNSKMKNEEKLIIKVRSSKPQNPFREKDTIIKNKIKYNNSVKFNLEQIRQNKANSIEKNNLASYQLIQSTITSPGIHKYNCYMSNTNVNNNNKNIEIQNKSFESQYLTSRKQNSSNYNTTKKTEKKNNDNNDMLIPKIKITSDINKINNRPYLNQIYVSENPNNIYMIHRKNKNYTNSITTDTDSSKEKNINIKNDKLKLNEKEGILKQTIIKGGKFNNIQTTYIISSKNPNSKGIIKVNKNPILNYKINNRIKDLNLNNINNINNSYNNYFTQTPSKSNTETLNTLNSARNIIHICEKNPKKDVLHNYKLNTAKNSNKTIKKIVFEKNKENLSNNYSIPKNRYNNNKYITNYNHKNESNINNIKYYNLTRITDNNIQYFDNNNTINYDTYNNTLDYNLYWNNPQGYNCQVSGLKSFSRYYNY